MKKTNKIFSVLLAVVMIFSAMSVSLLASAVDFTAKPEGLWADPAKGLVQATVTNDGNANAVNATVLLDFLDAVLAGTDVKFEINYLFNTLTVDLTSVNGLLKTIDTVKNASWILKFGTLKQLNVKNWTAGKSRANTGDYQILNDLISFINDNRAVVSAVVDGSFTCGILDPIIEAAAGIDIGNLMAGLVKNDDGLYGFLKATVAKLIYPYEIKDENGNVVGEDSALKAKYTAAYKKAFDAILLEDGLGYGLNGLLKKADDALKAVEDEKAKEIITNLYGWGFKLEGLLDSYKYDSTKTLDATIAQIADIIYSANKEYIKKMLYTYGAELQALIESNEYSAPFASHLKYAEFTASSDYSFLNFTNEDKSIKGINKFIGKFVAGVTDYTAWNNSKNLGYNFTAFVKWALTSIDTKGTPYEGYNFSGNNEQVALALAKMIVNIVVTDDAVKATLNKCTTTKEVITKLVPELCKSNEAIVIGAKSTTWEQVLGDIAGSFLADYANLYTDTANKTKYVKGSSKGIWDVLNYAANYYLVDLNFDTLFGCSMTKSESFLAKADKLQAKVMAGLEYSKASVLIPSLLNNVFSLNLEAIVAEGVEGAFTNINKSVSAVKLAYTLIDNVLKAIVGQSIFNTPNFASATVLDTLIQNKNLGSAVEKLLNGVNTRKADLLPVILFVFSSIDGGSEFTVKAGTDGTATVKYGTVTLKSGTHYTISTAKGVQDKSSKVTVTGKGNYAGKVTVVSNCKNHKYGAYTVTKKATCTATGSQYKVCSLCGKKVTETIAKVAHKYENKITPATLSKNGKVTPTCSVCKATKTATTVYSPKTFKLSKTAYTYTGKALKPTVTVKDSKGNTLKSGTDYTVKYADNTKVGKATVTITFKGKYSGTKKLTFAINPKATSMSKVTAASKGFTANWKKASDITGYEIQYSTSKKFTDKTTKTIKVTSAKTVSKKVTKLKASTTYYVRVRTYKTVSKVNYASDWSKALSVKTKK